MTNSLRFLDKYVSRAVGYHNFLRLSRLNKTIAFLDKVTAPDIACTILVYKNATKVWKEENCRSGQAQQPMMRGVRQRIKKQLSWRTGGASAEEWRRLDR
jgi:hypothetical protein